MKNWGEIRVKLYLVFIFTIIDISLLAQYGKPIHYTQDNGLTTESMYSCNVDNEGFAWFASETGASRFNGTEFEHYKANEGIVANSILYFKIDSKNRIWANSLSGDINYFWQGQWHQTEELERIINAKLSLNQGVRKLKVVNDILVIPDTSGITILFFNEQKELQYKKFKKGLKKTEFVRHVEIKDKKLKLITDSNSIVLDVSFIKTKQPNTPDIGYYFLNGNTVNYYKNNRLTKVNIPNTKEIHEVLYKDSFLYITGSDGFIRYKQTNDTLFIKNTKPILDIPCVSLSMDANKNIWVCSQFNGVYFFPYQFGKANTYNDLKGDFLLKTLETSQHKLIALTSFGKILNLESNHFKTINDLNVTSYDFQIHNNNQYFLSSNKLLKNNQKIYDSVKWFKSMVIDETKNEIIIGCGDRLIQVKPKFETLIDFKMANRIYGMLNYNNKLILGTDKGAFLYKAKKITPLDMGAFSNTKNIGSITCDGDSTLFFLSRNLGVILKHQNNQILLKEHEDLLSEPTCIFSPKSGILMIGTRKGLNVVHYTINPLKINFIKTYTNTNGLTENKINTIGYNSTRDKLIITFNASIQILPIELLLGRTRDSRLYFKYINAEKVSYKSFENIAFKFDENNLEIGFSAIDYASESINGYAYRLIGASDKWSNISGRIVKFSDLSPGNYIFELKINSNYNDNPAVKLNFKILPAFWQTLWFRILTFVLVVSFFLGFIAWYLKKTKKTLEEKANIKSKMADLELEAQKTRLKPHFIFNCLTAIQYYIKKNQFSKADDYLVNFSKLIRQSLDLSNSDETTVEQELNFTTRYIELEHMRFEGLFEYNIQIDKKLLREKMPSLILQTFVENAINHGLRYKENGKGALHLTIKKNDNHCIEITIADNGIGIENAKAYKKKSHISKGLDIINQRIEAYNKKHAANIVISTSNNNTDENDKGYKTTITICKK